MYYLCHFRGENTFFFFEEVILDTKGKKKLEGYFLKKFVYEPKNCSGNTNELIALILHFQKEWRIVLSIRIKVNRYVWLL